MRLGALALACMLALPTSAAGVRPKLEVAVLEARTHVDGQWFGENAYHFRVAGLRPHGLDGKTLTWTLSVKRKGTKWRAAKSWLMGKQRVEHGIVSDMAFALLYRSLAKAKLRPGEHVAAIVAAVDGGREVYRGEVAFELPTDGRHAYRPDELQR
ncbi:MAG: hypothetical protein A2138_23255 [Deltaproteobacteria bacterium RBG_16_71_12]|nr:MAG: hypothetical protein A2138_23255 [Deltaproteobacteria bacterium RBG_16_71_12]